MLFFKNLSLMIHEKQEKSVFAGETAARFPQVFYQAFVMTTGVMHDIE